MVSPGFSASAGPLLTLESLLQDASTHVYSYREEYRGATERGNPIRDECIWPQARLRLSDSILFRKRERAHYSLRETADGMTAHSQGRIPQLIGCSSNRPIVASQSLSKWFLQRIARCESEGTTCDGALIGQLVHTHAS